MPTGQHSMETDLLQSVPRSLFLIFPSLNSDLYRLPHPRPSCWISGVSPPEACEPALAAYRFGDPWSVCRPVLQGGIQ